MIKSVARKARGLCTSDLGMRFLAEAAARGGGFVVMPLLSWVLGAAVFGSYTQILSLSFAFVPIVSFGLGYTVIRRIAARSDAQEASGVFLFSICLVSSLCLLLAGILIMFAYEISGLLSLSEVFEPSDLAIAVSALAWGAAMEALVQEYFRALKWVRSSLFVQLASIGLHLVCLLVVVSISHLSIWSALAAIVITKLAVVSFVLTRVLLSRKVENENQQAWPSTKMLISGVPFMLAGLAEWTGNLGDRLIVGKYLGPEMVAQYTASIMLLSIIVAIGAPFWWLLFPEIVRHKNDENNRRCREIVQQRTMNFFEFALPALTLICLVADPAISLLVNTQATGMSHIVFVLGLGVFVNQLATGWEYFVVSVSTGTKLMTATILCAVLGFVAATFLVPYFGILGVALGVFLGKLMLASTYAVLANRKGFSGMVWRVKRASVIVVINVIVFCIVAFVTSLLPFKGMGGQLIGATFLFFVLYGLGHFSVLLVSRANAQNDQ